MSSKMRVYEVAKQLNLDQKDQKQLVALIQSWGLTDVKNHMSVIDPDVFDRVKRHYDKLKQPAAVEERVPIIKRRAAKAPEAAPPAPAPSGPQVPPPAPSASVPAVAAVKPARASGAVPAPPASRSSGKTNDIPEGKAEPRVPAVESPRASSQVSAPKAARASTKVDKVEAKAEVKTEVKAEAKTEVKAEAPQAEPPARAEVKAEVKAEPTKEPEAKVEAKVETPPEPPKAAPEPPRAEARPETKVEAPSPTEARPTEARPATPPAPPSPPDPPAAAKSEAPPQHEVTPVPAPQSAPEAEEPPPVTVVVVSPPKPASAPPAAAKPSSPAPQRPAASSPPPRHGNPPRHTEPQRPAPAPASAQAPATIPPRGNQPSSAPPAATGGSRPSAVPGAPPVKKTGVEVWSGWQPKGPPASSASSGRPSTHGPRRQIHNVSPPNNSGRPGGPQGQQGRPGGSGPQSSRPPGGGRPPYSQQGGKFQGRFNQGPQSRPPPGGGKINTQERKEKIIKIEGRVNLQTLAAKMSLKANEVLQKLLQFGMQGVHINSTLDFDTAKIIASEFGWELEDVEISEEQQLTEARGEPAASDEDSVPRPPIVTVMGHVDHGKTSLLDQIRKANVAGGEAGGITQHIGAYRVQSPSGHWITFLDTPGHEAFTAMRARGANLTDIVVLVVAADDGVMPQTREAVTHAKAAKVPIIVAINKIDKPEAQPERIKRQLMELNLVPEEFGGDTTYCEVSAKTRQGIDGLLESILLQAEVGEAAQRLKANPKRPARAIVVESLLDKGKGPVARIIVLDGTIRVSDYVISGSSIGKIRAMTNDLGQQIKEAGPSTPVEILGLSDVPNAGDPLDSVSEPKKAQELVERRKTEERRNQSAQQRETLDGIRKRLLQGDQQLELRVLIKADVQGSVEALSAALQKLTSPKVKLSIVDASVGAINESDVNLAIAAKTIIVGFNVRPAGKALQLAETEGVQIKLYSIIYKAIDEIRSAMEGLLPPTYNEKPLGRAEVRVVFKLTKAGMVAGCMVTEGQAKRSAKVRVRRGNEVVHDGKIVGLKRIKEDVKEVAEGTECGISVEDYEDIKAGDILEIYELEEVRQKL